MTVYDYIIVGGGIAGLYTAFLLKTNGVDNFLIIEKSGRVGGRIDTAVFNGTKVVKGAGIGRSKDKLLKRLLTELDVKHSSYTGSIQKILPRVADTLEMVEYMKTVYNQEHRSTLIFKDFAKKHLGEKGYIDFCNNVGLTDYLYADVYDTLYDYGFEDMVDGYGGISIDWTDLLEKLVNSIGKERIHLEETIVKLDKNELWRITTTKHQAYKCKKLVLAIPPKAVYDIIKDMYSSRFLYRKIPYQSFCRLYVTIDPEKSQQFMEKIGKFSIVEPPLQKIIKMAQTTSGDQVYMLSYSDNLSADWVEFNHNDLDRISHMVKKTTGCDIQIKTLLCVYWDVGTHYFSPLANNYRDRDEFLREVQNPVENLYVVGEAYSRNQGWVEGALHSVKSIWE
jgi:hypothetical protein